MRFLGIVGLATLGLSAFGCADSKGSSVNDDVNWIAKCAGGGCTNFTYHDQKMSKKDYKVTCHRSGTMMDITIRDPGFEGSDEQLGQDMHAPGSIILTNVDPVNQRCNVEVRDAMSFGASEVKLVGACAGSRDSLDQSSCTVTGQFNSQGWDWIGTLICDKLPNYNLPTQVYKLESANSAGAPIQIAVDNCD